MIYRASPAKRYTVIPHDFIEDERLSLKAKGLLLFILSRPPGWHISARALIALPELGTDGKDSVISALHELERCGYLSKTKIQKNGSSQWISTVYEESKNHKKNKCAENPHTLTPLPEKTCSENPQCAENPHTLAPLPEEEVLGKSAMCGKSAHFGTNTSIDHSTDRDNNNNNIYIQENNITEYLDHLRNTVDGENIGVLYADAYNTPCTSPNGDVHHIEGFSHEDNSLEITDTVNPDDTATRNLTRARAREGALAVQLNTALLEIHKTKNKISAVGDLYILCFGFEPDWNRLGMIVKKFGAYKVAHQFTLLIGRPPVDPVAYVQGVLENERKTKRQDDRTAKGSVSEVLGDSSSTSVTTTSCRNPVTSGKVAQFVEIDD